MTEQPTTDPTTPDTTATDVWERLAAPFDTSWIEKLPKQLRRGDENKTRCEEGTHASADGHYCGGWHARSVHLDYIGHAGITMRLNSVVGPGGWQLEPVATTDEGLPLMARGEFWARLTILNVSKVDLAANFNSTQEAWGDALRRTAMRFGIGTYLWAKSEFAAELAAYREPDDARAQELADLIDAGKLTPAELNDAEARARREGYLTARIKVGDGEGTLAAYIDHARPHIEAAHGSQEPPAQAAQESQNAAQEPPAPAPGQEEPSTPAPGPQDASQDTGLEFARAALEEASVEVLRDLYRMAGPSLAANVIGVVGDDDLAALDLALDPDVEAGVLSLGRLLVTINAYVGRHGAAVRDLGEPAASSPPVEDPNDPWAAEAAAGYPDAGVAPQ